MIIGRGPSFGSGFQLNCYIMLLPHSPMSTHKLNFIHPVTDVAFRQAWDRLRHRANIAGFNFHDLRHEAISRIFDCGMKILEVTALSGHRTASQLFRYVQVWFHELGTLLLKSQPKMNCHKSWKNQITNEKTIFCYETNCLIVWRWWTFQNVV